MSIITNYLNVANFWQLCINVAFLCPASWCFSQNDTIFLHELVITNRPEKEKVEIIRLRENCRRAEGMHNISELISHINSPAGYLHHVSFYFNKRDYPNNDEAVGNLKDSQFRLMIYEVRPDGLPGREISDVNKIITVPWNHKGKLTVGLRELNIYTYGNIYIGLEKIDSNTGFFFDTFCYLPDTPQAKKDKYKTFSKNNNSETWRYHIGCLSIHMDLGVSIPK